MPLPDRGITFKIFLGNLAEGVTNDDIRPLFEAYGEVVECDVVGNYGFVHMRNAPEGEAAIAALNGHSIKGKTMRVEASKSKPPSKPSVKIFVGNLAEGTDPTELKAIFEQYGPVLECDVLKNFAFIHMEKGEDTNRAIRELHSHDFNGNPINVQVSTSRVRTKPGMGQPDQCYRCGKSGHWSKECPADRYGGGGGGFAPRGRGAPRGRDGGFSRGGGGGYPSGGSKMYARRYDDDYYGGGGDGNYSSYGEGYRGGYNNGGSYSYDAGNYSAGGSYSSDYPSSGGGGGYSYSSGYQDYGSPSGGRGGSRGGSRGGRGGGSRYQPY